MAAHVLQREVDAMRRRVDGDRMRVSGELGLPELLHSRPAQREDGDDAALARDVEAVQTRVVGEDVRGLADRRDVALSIGREVNGREPPVVLARDEGKLCIGLEIYAMCSLATGQFDP